MKCLIQVFDDEMGTQRESYQRQISIGWVIIKQLLMSPTEYEHMGEDGFSSDEQMQHEEVIVDERASERIDHNHKEQVRFIVPPPEQIKQKQYSLRPDIATGWAYKMQLPVPIPIVFENYRLDALLRRMLKHPNSKARILYLGPRYENTFYAWYDKGFPFPYEHINAPKQMKFTDWPFCGQHWEAEEGLIFDSFFESGNLDCVFQSTPHEYDCFMRVDSNTAGHLQWFNFKVRNMQRNVKYRINICNFQKDKTLFARGMRPYIYSSRRMEREGVGWEQAGDNVRFDKRVVHAAKVYEIQMKATYRLSFEYTTTYDRDELQVAYCVPYTYTRLNLFLAALSSKNKAFLTQGKLTNSLGGLDIPLLTIHEGISHRNQDKVQKKCVVISGRAHPGEANGSHMMEGFIQYLCSDAASALYLRKNIVFKIVPMLNPDGVTLGNYRTGLSGRDFNREFKEPDKAIFPQVYAMKRLVADCKCQFRDDFLMFLDYHGHSTKKNTFMYGPEFQIIDKYYYECRLFPKILSNHTNMFRYYSCVFKINEFKQTTARAIVLRKLKIPLTYTIETSNGYYFDYEKLKDIPYSECLWKGMGSKIATALQQYVQMNKEDDLAEEGEGGSKPQKEEDNEEAILIERIKLLVEEIKQAEEQKHSDKISDDEMSEGSSDQDDELNDLSPKKCNYLFKVIKNKDYSALTKCKLFANQTNEVCHVRVSSEAERKEEEETDESGLLSHQIFRKKNQVQPRKIMSSKEKSTAQTQKRIVGAKIINFSFMGQTPRKASYDARKMYEASKAGPPTKSHFLQMFLSKWANKEANEYKPKAVVDLSEVQYRQTHAGNFPSVTKEDQLRAQFLMQANKKGKFDQYKYRRLLLHSQVVEKH